MMDVVAEKPAKKCARCGYTTASDQHYHRHINRKKPCGIVENKGGDNRCIQCNRVFANKYVLKKHDGRCPIKHGGIAAIPDPNVRLAEQVRIMAEEQKRKDEEREKEKEEQKRKDEEKDREMAELRAMIKDMISRPAVVNVGTVNNGPVTNIIVNTFDNPNYQHWMEKTASANIRAAIEKHLMALPIELVTPLWFNLNHPENHSVIVDPKKPTVCKVFGEHGWELRDTAESANDLRKLACDVARKLIREHAPDIKGISGGIEDKKYSQGVGTQQDNATIIKKMILGSQLIAAGK